MIPCAVSAAAGLLAALWFALPAPAGLPLDDAWIHADHARALATSGDLSAGGAGVSSAVTSPLWTLLMALAFAVTSDPVMAVRLLALVVMPLLAAGMCLLGMAANLGQAAAALAGLTAATSGPLLWLNASGMESALFAAAFPFAVFATVRRRPWLLGSVVALATLTRIEGVILAAPLAAMLLRDRDARLLPGVAIPALTMAAFAAFNVAVIGQPLPSTLEAKRFAHGVGLLSFSEDVALFASGWAGYIRHAFGTISTVPLGGWALAIASAAGAIVLAMRRPAAAGWLLAIAIAVNATYVIALPVIGAAGRYQVANWLFVPLLVAAATDHLARRDAPAWKAAAAAAAFAVLAASSGSAAGWRTAFAGHVRHIQDAHVTAGAAIARLNDDCRPVLVYDVGAIAYFARTPSCTPELVDLGGLIDSSLLPVLRGPRAIQRLALEHGGHVLLALPTTPAGRPLCPPLGLLVEGRAPSERLVDPEGLLALEKAGEMSADRPAPNRWIVQANATRLSVWRVAPTEAGEALMRSGQAAIAALSEGPAPAGAAW